MFNFRSVFVLTRLLFHGCCFLWYLSAIDLHSQTEKLATPNTIPDVRMNVETLWLDQKYADYFDSVRNSVAGALSRRQLSSQEFHGLISLAKECIGRRVDPQVLGSQIDLVAKTEIVSAFINYDLSESPDADALRNKASELISEFLSSIENEIIPGYEQMTVVANVSPPAGTPLGAAGMSPSAITDPALRAEYEKAIRTNAANIMSNTRQALLRRTIGKIAPAAKHYSQRMLSAKTESETAGTRGREQATRNVDRSASALDKSLSMDDRSTTSPPVANVAPIPAEVNSNQTKAVGNSSTKPGHSSSGGSTPDLVKQKGNYVPPIIVLATIGTMVGITALLFRRKRKGQ
jgi:hypothetical protein